MNHNPEIEPGVPQIAVGYTTAGKMLGVGKSTVYEVIKTGALKPRKLRNRRVLLIEEIKEYARSLPIAEIAA